MRYVSGTKLDERVIRCDLDPGYREGRQFGRGKNGGQVSRARVVFSAALPFTYTIFLFLPRDKDADSFLSTLVSLQVRDEFRQEYDAGRGGWGHQRALAEKQAQEDRAREAQQFEVYAGQGGTGLNGGEVPGGEGADQSESPSDTFCSPFVPGTLFAVLTYLARTRLW